MSVTVQYDELAREFGRVLCSCGFSEERAALSARLFADTSLDGVHSHGVNRFPMYVDYIRRGIIDVKAEPSLVASFGPMERWDGNLGPGNLNAWKATDRAVQLAREFGMGCVALRNTNHWMRGGTYGWKAADENCIAICFTNAIPGMPPWGARENKIGNNPFVIAVPRPGGHIVLDMALSQFSYGRMEDHRLRGEPLPVPGGFDGDGNLTNDAGAILDSGKPLPAGFWKGSGLAMVLDIVAAVLSSGRPTPRIGADGDEFGVSQVFMLISVDNVGAKSCSSCISDEVVEFIHSAQPVNGDGNVRYPGERTLATRNENLKNGITVNKTVWEEVQSL